EEIGQILDPLAQRRHANREHVQPKVEILAKLLLRDAGGEIAMARREYPHVDAPRLMAADALERALLQHSEQLDLHVGAHVPDLVEEQRAAVGELEAADSTRDRPRERALLVTEELALEKLLR